MRQTLPVVTKGTRNQVLDATILRSPLWRPSDWTIHHLHTNMRVQRLLQQGLDSSDQATFAAWLLRIGDGVDGPLVELRPDIIHPSTNPADLIATVYGSFDNPAHRLPSYLKGRCIVAPKNNWVTDLNRLMTDSFPGNSKTYTSVNEVSNSVLSILYSIFSIQYAVCSISMQYAVFSMQYAVCSMQDSGCSMQYSVQHCTVHDQDHFS